ncbi:MAG: restriction endonuclease subunit S [Cytophagaceae bacterium]|nr:MAG: restriction endonuclease subunit S [Cytophagaceae bacterium]
MSEVQLPEGWVWKKLSKITHIITDGDHQAPPKSETGIPFIVISNIKNNRIDFSQARFVPEGYYDSIKDLRKARKGDLLYTVTGSYGIPVLINTEEKFCFQRHIGLIKPDKQLVIPEYLFHALSSPNVYNQATAVATGTAQLTVPLSGLRNFTIPLPPLPVQHQIVARIEELFSELEAGVNELKTALSRLKTYRQAVLHPLRRNGASNSRPSEV